MFSKKRFAIISALAMVVAIQAPLTSTAALSAGDYIVVFDNKVNEQSEAAKLRSEGADIKFIYSAVFKGLAGTFNEAQLAALQRNPRVKLIEKDAVVTADAQQTSVPSWGIDRIDQTTGLDNTYNYTANGAGVKAYVIDTGILATHTDFGGRAIPGYSAFADKYKTSDCNGHGTHVSGTIGGTNYGVAKAVTLVAVRVLNCQGSGTTSGVVAGINWVISDHGTGPAVANMSLGGGASSAIDTAVANLVADGVVVSVAAGNSNVDACSTSPARVASAITVGATDSSDNRASYSNYGPCLDLFAPGSAIKSAWSTSNTATNTISGTSMATPHVTGVAALYLSANPTFSLATTTVAATVRDWIVTTANTGIVKSRGTNSPDEFLFKSTL